MYICVDSAEEAFHAVLAALKNDCLESAPRGMKVKEMLNACITITNPRDRIISCRDRAFSAAYAFGEFLWYMSGRNDLKFMSYYSKFMERGTDDGKTLNSAYGYRIFEGKHPLIPFDQWENVLRLLRNDPDSRQAIIHLHTPNNKPTKDDVCTLSLQFLLRDGKLDMITTMRSNDLVLGFTYDVFAFTMMQEMMANDLGVELGEYHHNVGSMHVYENKFFLFDGYIRSAKIPAMLPFKLTRSDFTENTIVDNVAGFERMLREVVQNEEIKRRNDCRVTAFDSLCEEKDPLKAFIKAAFFMKYMDNVSGSHIYERRFNADFQSAALQHVRSINETYADVLQMQSKAFTKGGNKIIVEGIDGAGKTTYVNAVKHEMVDNDGNELLMCVKHYCKPSESFDFFSNYKYDLQSSEDCIYDRFFFSELAYHEHARVTNAQLSTLVQELYGDYEKIKFVFFVARNIEQLCAVSKRLNEEDKSQSLFNAVQNNVYLKWAEKLKADGFDVEIRDIEF